MQKIKYKPRKITLKSAEIPDPNDYELKDEDRILLNRIRLSHFLSPDGSNREYYKKISADVVESLLDFYLPDAEGKTKLREVTEKDEGLNSDEETERLRTLRFDNLSSVKDAVDGNLTREELNKLKREIPDEPKRLETVLMELDELTNPSIRFNQRFIGEMHPHDLIAAMQASYISKFLNHNVVAQKVSPTITYLENLVIEWLRESIGYSPQNPDAKCLGGNVVSGGTMANLTAMVIARNKILTYKVKNEETGDIKEVSPMDVGLSEIRPYLETEGYETAAIFISERSHYSLKEKLANVTGIGVNNIVEIETDSEGRIIPEDLEAKIKKAKIGKKKPIAIIATAGTTEEGMIDPLRRIGAIAKENGMYYHIDAAHGGGFLISDLIKDRFDGIELADSVTLDGHKMLYTLYPCGTILFKDPEDAKKHIKQRAEYLWKEDTHLNSGNQTIEGSRGTDGILQLYAGIRSLGKKGYETIHKHVNNLARYLHDLLEASNEFKAIMNPDLNVVLYRYEPSGFYERAMARGISVDPEVLLDEINKELPDKAYKDGAFYVGETEIKHKHYIKAIVMHPYTETSTIKEYLDFVNGVAHSVEEEVLAKYAGK